MPNEADFAKAGISTAGKQVGVTSDLMFRIFRDKTTAQDATVAFSKTDNKEVKAINADWSNTWSHNYFVKARLSRFDGTNLDVSNVTNMSHMFEQNQISDLSTLANWKVDHMTNMSGMFRYNQVSDLSPLANWKVDHVTNMDEMFRYNQISDLSPLANWNVNNVTNMGNMFEHNQISDLSPLTNWKVDNVTDMSEMFDQNQISDLSPLANWKVDNVFNMSGMFDDNISSIPTKTVQAKRIINFVYPASYTGKKQDPITQTVNVPIKQVKVELTTKDSKTSNNILDWVTKTETPEAPDPVYFLDYTVPTVSNLVPSISTVAKQEADPNKPINVTVTYTASPVTVHFVDVDENADKDSDAVKQDLGKTVQLSGTYGSNVDLSNIKLPENFVLDDTLPSVQYGKTDSVTINLKHYINDVKAENVEDATRTIVIKKFNGNGNLTSTQTVVQRIAFYKHDYVDAVTNETKSSKYIFDDKSSPALSHNLVDGKATNDPSYVLQNGKYYFAKYKLDVPAGYKVEEKKINPNMMMISLFALPTTLTDPNTSQTDTNKKPDTSSSSVITKPNDSKTSHDDSKKQNDQPIVSNNETDHTINVSAQAVDPTVEPEDHNIVASQNNSTTSAPTQQNSTNDAEQVKNTSIDVPSREENNANKGSNSSSNRSKPDSGKITHINLKAPQKGLNEASKAQSVVSQPSNSVIKNSETSAKKLPQTGESDGFNYSALGVLLGLNVAITAVGAEKKRKKY